ncbi:hypothetical protein, partial [Pseudomonas sp. CGJS7]|uniref:hypothetical protein n=1 Tax=Pseudomonas sp. CGJS7 TaxID=3109348 RepID=UPI00300A077E
MGAQRLPPRPDTPRPSLDPKRPLFDLSAIAVACLIGSMIAGVWLISMNYVALRRLGAAWAMRLVVVPPLAYAAIHSFGYAVNAHGAALAIAALIYFAILPAAAYLIGDWMQGAAIRARAAAGLPARPLWQAAMVALAFVVLAAALPLIL